MLNCDPFAKANMQPRRQNALIFFVRPTNESNHQHGRLASGAKLLCAPSHLSSIILSFAVVIRLEFVHMTVSWVRTCVCTQGNTTQTPSLFLSLSFVFFHLWRWCRLTNTISDVTRARNKLSPLSIVTAVNFTPQSLQTSAAVTARRTGKTRTGDCRE